MALIKCKECQSEVSDNAKNCPNCGASLEKKSFCANCGNEVLPGAAICVKCGHTIPNQPNPANTKATATNAAVKNETFSLIGFVVSIISCFIDLFGLVSITAIVLSIIGLNNVKNSGGALKGKGLAIAGIIIGAIECFLKFIQLMGLFEL